MEQRLDATQPEGTQPQRPRSRYKCSSCREDKKACERPERHPDERCQRCKQKNRPCGPSINTLGQQAPQQAATPSLTTSQSTTNDGIVDAPLASNHNGVGPPRNLQVPKSTRPRTRSSSVEEHEDDSNLEILITIALHAVICNRSKDSLPPRATQDVQKDIWQAGKNLEQIIKEAKYEFNTRSSRILQNINHEHDPQAEQKYNDILTAMQFTHSKSDEIFAEQERRVLRKSYDKRLTSSRHSAACLLRHKVVMSLAGRTKYPQSRHQEWRECVLQTSRQLAVASKDCERNSAPPLQLALLLNLGDDILSGLLATSPGLLTETNILDRSPLHVAVECSDLAAIRLILAAAFQLLHQKDSLHMTPILVAAYLSDLDCFRELENAGANLADRYEINQGVLELACQAGKLDIVEYLLNHSTRKFEVNGLFGGEQLIHAAKGGFQGICMLLLQKGADPSLTHPEIPDKTAAIYANEHGHTILAHELWQRQERWLLDRRRIQASLPVTDDCEEINSCGPPYGI